MASLQAKAIKLIKLSRYPSLLRVVLNHRVAASTEHFSAIRFSAANTLIDAGANKGQFSLAFRAIRPQSQVIAFEPLPRAANLFERVLGPDMRTELKRVALAGSEGSAQFHVADRPDSSSLLRPGVGQELAFGIRGVGTIEVSVKRLDSCVELSKLRHPILLKVDVQGGELEVFRGCDTLSELDFIYVELSFIELYEGQPLFQEVCEYLSRRGFAVAGIFNQVVTAEFGPTQADVLFRRR